MRLILLMTMLLSASVMNAQEQTGDDGPALPEGAIAERTFHLITGEEDVRLFTPKPQVQPVGERCNRIKQLCEFEAEISERGALEYRWHAETNHVSVFGSSELPDFTIQFRRPSPKEGYFVKLRARRLDSPGDQWHEAEYIVHIDGRDWWWNAAIVAASVATGAVLSRINPDNVSHTTRDRIIGGSIGLGVGLVAAKISW